MKNPERCAYCNQPLRLVAGFCADCHAPATIARHYRLVARSRRDGHLAAAAPSTGNLALSVAQDPGLVARQPIPRWVYVIMLLSLISLALATWLIAWHIATYSTISADQPSTSALLITLPGASVKIPAATVGETVDVTLATRLDHAAIVTLSIQAPGMPVRQLAERWPAGDMRRVVPITPLIAGSWSLTLRVDGQDAQSLRLIVTA